MGETPLVLNPLISIPVELVQLIKSHIVAAAPGTAGLLLHGGDAETRYDTFTNRSSNLAHGTRNRE